MRFNNNKIKNHLILRIITIIFIGLLASTILMNVSAKHKEFEVEEFQEQYTILNNKIQTIDFSFQEGKKLEIIYNIQVTDGLPIDIWFVNEDNYLLLSGGNQFLYFIDGTDQEISYAKKIITLTKHDNYKLILTNYYSNQTIGVNITGEIRTLLDNTVENHPNSFQIVFYSLILITIVFIILTIVLSLKLHRSNQKNNINIKKKSDKKNKSKKSNKNKKKNKKTQNLNSNHNKKINKTNSNPSSYCGFCGESVDTPFCKKCGEKI